MKFRTKHTVYSCVKVGLVSLLLLFSSFKHKVERSMKFEEIQLTDSAYGHTLNSTQVFSKDDQWIAYDTRNYDSAIASTCCIEMVNVDTKEVQTLYTTRNQTEYGPGVGAATFSPTRDSVLFIHGIRNADKDNPYSTTRRTGVAIDIKHPQRPVFMDARDIEKPYTPGALRGGTHAHTWSGDGKWISFTYNDYITAQLAASDPTVRDLRTVGIMVPKAVEVNNPDHSVENNSGAMFSVVVARVVEDPKNGSDEIDKAFDETWIGKNGYKKPNGKQQKKAIAFQGNVKDQQGNTKTEVFVVDLPPDPTHPRKDKPLEGTDNARPQVPENITQRRITHTQNGIGGPRFWLRSRPDGSLIFFLMKDDKGIVQLFGISPNGGAISQITFNDFPVQGPFNVSPDGKYIAYPADNSVFLVNIESGKSFRITRRFSEQERPMGAPVWSNAGNELAYMRPVKYNSGYFLQIFLLKKQLEKNKPQASWEVPAQDRSSLPEATYTSLTQIYDQQALNNRRVTYRDERLLSTRGIKTTYSDLPVFDNLEAWEKRKDYLKKHILVSAGLWPMPQKTALHPKYYHKTVHDDYIVETVTIEPYPGFYLGGNVYRPKGEGPYPAILSPHGHFKYGRLTDNAITSIPGRCINFARQGYVVFAYDMVGYNDTKQLSHTFADDSISKLYGINLLGLQLWNSIRALDFLLSLPEVDTSRVGITGASGGGTQTFLLTAVDHRFDVAAPVNMVSNVMQGGDLCENAPGLRVNTFNVEIASMIAPKPLLLVSNTHDWTYNTRNTIMPMMQSIYDLYAADHHLKNEHFDFPHNYNKASRESVYQWFGKWLQKEKTSEKWREKPFKVDKSQSLLAFMNQKTANPKKDFKSLPAADYHNAPIHLDESKLKNQLKALFSRQLQDFWPKDKKQVGQFNDLYGTAIKHLTEATTPEAISYKIRMSSKGKNFTATSLLISRKDKNEWIPCILYRPLSKANATVILTADQGKAHWVRPHHSTPDSPLIQLLEKGFNILVPDLFMQGEHVLQDATKTKRDKEEKYFSTYNRTDKQQQIQDILTLIKAVKENKSLTGSIHLWATGQTGMTALLLAPLKNHLHQIVIDGAHFDPTTDQSMKTLQIPGIMRIGGLKTVLGLTSLQHKGLLLYNAHPKIFYPEVEKMKALKESNAPFILTEKKMSIHQIISFLQK